ncbi:MAG: VWA domain-containing protein [Bauldia sp.]|nr:VWA domain-containing protein [Bauldia sp.]
MAARETGFLKLVDEATPAPAEAAALLRKAFPEPYAAAWLRAVAKLRDAGYGQSVVGTYELHGPRIALLVGPEPAIEMADLVSTLAIRSGRRAAECLSVAGEGVARRFADADAFRRWLAIVTRFVGLAPESAASVLDRMDSLLVRLSLGSLESWLLAGIRGAGNEVERRREFFLIGHPEAERLLRREAGEVIFADMDRRMKAYVDALFGVRVPIREPAAGAPEASRRRTSFSEGLIRMPPTYPGFRGDQAETVFRAALAHIGAHYRHSGGRFPIGKLKPMQVALVSLIEDARVEYLAMRDFPGLARLWKPFHVAEAAGGLVAQTLFARLSRALIDPDFDDGDTWVRKGRAMFVERLGRIDDPAISREIGNILGNDLGQMRIQFNAKTYVVEPAYRDDNLGLWDMGDEQSPPTEMQEVIYESVKLTRTENPEEQPPDRERQEPEQGEAGQRTARLAEEPEELGMPVARYPEYDHLTGRERAEWTTVLEYRPRPGSLDVAEAILERNQVLVDRIAGLIRSAKVSRPQRLRRQIDGEALDIDAVIDAAIARRGGDVPDPRVYQTMARRYRDLSVLVLLDVSQSTRDRVKGHVMSVLDLEREATLLLAYAMSEIGDPFAIAAFCSNQRDDVRYMRVKDFGQPYDAGAVASLVGLHPGYSTRLGAALRHAGADLRAQHTHRRLVLVISDGEPSDVDCPDPRYLVEDARRAVQTLGAQGIDVFCVGLDSGGDAYLARIFGRNVTQLDRIERLPERLPMLYLRLTA